jgi:predicted nucleic acid-binding Zn ribbon protein
MKLHSKSPKNITKLAFIFVLFGFIISCTKDSEEGYSVPTKEYSSDVLLNYIDFVCKTARVTEGFFPPQAARAYGYIGLANYEAVVHGIDPTKSMRNQLNGFSSIDLPVPDLQLTYNWAIASNAALARMTSYMFEKKISQNRFDFLKAMEVDAHTKFAQSEHPEVAERSRQFGYQIAEAIYNYSQNDGGHESYLNPFQLPYEMPQGESDWVPTGADPSPLSPRWGYNRPFMDINIAWSQPPAHVAFSTDVDSEFYKEAMVVYNQVSNNTNEQEEIAKYWADDPFATCTPAGHSFNILAQLLAEEKCSLEKASVAICRMAIAQNDAFICCWKGKYDYNLLRPYTYIRRYIDPGFNTVIGTPPFPAYTSGHSSEIGAADRILTMLFTNGSGDYLFTDYSQLQFGFNARNFKNFSEMADECANSRLYGGIHFPMDNSRGLQIGRAIGDNVNRRLSWPKDIR